jgi:DNA repair photolyase
MIISASRRTDIPAFYSPWLMNRVRAGYCTVPNPFNRNQVSRVSLLPQDVDVIVFWTRNPRPLLAHLQELDDLGYRYYFQYTLLDNPRSLDPKSPGIEAGIKTFRELAARVGPNRVVWRYDPIVLSAATPPDWHERTHVRIAEALAGHTTRCVVSVVDVYKKALGRLKQLKEKGVVVEDLPTTPIPAAVAGMLRTMAETAGHYGIELVSCAEDADFSAYGIRPGKCIDDDLIQRVFGLDVTHKKDASQREACGCVASKDIGMYDTCLFGCQYCYATSKFERAVRNYAAHDPDSSSLQNVIPSSDQPTTPVSHSNMPIQLR